MARKTILVTGGARGLGLATAERLLRSGHRVRLTARDAQSGAQAIAQLRASVTGADVEALPLDLASFASVRALGETLRARAEPLDAVLHNAGVMQQSPTRRTVEGGLEETLATNVLGPFLLTKQLLPLLERSAPSRIVCVSSRLHLPGSRGTPVHFDFDDPQLERGYHPDRAYKNSKLAMLWLAYELDRRLAPRGVRANAVCPGFVPLTAAASTHGAQRLLLKYVLRFMPFASSVAQASQSFAWMCASPVLDGVGGKFFADEEEIASSDESHDAAKAARFWALAAELTKSGDWP